MREQCHMQSNHRNNYEILRKEGNISIGSRFSESKLSLEKPLLWRLSTCAFDHGYGHSQSQPPKTNLFTPKIVHKRSVCNHLPLALPVTTTLAIQAESPPAMFCVSQVEEEEDTGTDTSVEIWPA